ncbi:type III secretion system translocon subunit SctE [Paraburkholderia sp. BR10882]|uniref:type III secretion system translocon subunit SctE n=1 Tax=unclassified Paraburkholderia TaxID=2615204 RepID=UPI0034CF5AA0
MIAVKSKATADGCQEHPFREAISGLGTMASERYVDVVAKAQEQFLARLSQIASERNNSELSGRFDRRDDMPQLAAPAALRMESSNGVNSYGSGGQRGNDVQRFDDAVRLTQIVSDLMKLIERGSPEMLKSNAESWQARSDAAKEQLENASHAYERAVQDAADAVTAATDAADIAERCRSEADEADKDAEGTKERFDQAGNNHVPREELDRLKVEWKKACDVAKQADNAALAAARKAEAVKQQAVDASNSAADAESTVDSAITNAQTVFESSSFSHIAPAAPPLRGAAALTAIFAELVGLIAKGNLAELTANERFFQEMQARRLEQLQKKSVEYAKQVKKAEIMQKVMGRVGEILGWVAIVVSVVAVPFTSGGSLALAAVGLSLAVADEVKVATTGSSFTGELVNPVMERVLKPIISSIEEAITRALESCGVESDKAQTAGAIVGAVLASIAVLAAVVASCLLARGAVSSVTRLLSSQLARLMDSRLGRMVTRTVDNALEKLGGIRLHRSVVGLYMGCELVQAAGNIVVGLDERRAKTTLAAVKEALSDLKIIDDALNRAVEAFAQHNRTLSEIFHNISDTVEAEMLNGVVILRNARAV